MKICTVSAAAVVAALAGSALAQPVVDGVYDPGTEGGFYTLNWVQNQPTGFGDNEAGEFIDGGDGDVGDPENVTTGVEIQLPASILSGGSFRIAGWVNSGDRTFMSNQLIHDGGLPVDSGNVGGFPIDFVGDGRFPTTEWVTITPGAGLATLDGSVDGAYGSPQYVQTNYTGFGDNGDATEIGGGGSEIDAIYAISDGVTLSIFIAGNCEANGNGIDLYIDTDSGATGDNPLSGGGGAGGWIVDTAGATAWDGGFSPDYLVSVDSIDNGGTREPRLYAGDLSGVAEVGTCPGYGSANATSFGGNMGLCVDNSNVAGVVGSPVSGADTPMAGDVDWAYGCEINNVRSYLDIPNNRLHVFVGGNMEINYNKLIFWIDAQPGGQGTVRDDNVDISFNGLNRAAGLVFDAGFEADYWMNMNTGRDGAGSLQNFTDCSVIRTDGALIDPFFGVISDYGSYFGGLISETDGTPTDPRVKLIDFSGDRYDVQDGSLGSLFSNYGPRMSYLNSPSTPDAGLIQLMMDNSNVGGVTASDATVPDVSDAGNVNTGIEFSIDLDELGWDGSQDILLAGYVVSGGFDFVSNQVFGGLPDAEAPAENLGEVSLIDFNTITGTQHINLSDELVASCPGDLNGDGVVDFFDVSDFLTDFSGGCNPGVGDFNSDGICDFFDVGDFLTAYAEGCP